MNRPLAWIFIALVLLVALLPAILSGLRNARLRRHGLALPPKPDRDLRKPETHAWYLVTDLMLRFPAEVAEGRRRGDLGERLGEEITKSRRIFLEHQGPTPEMETLYDDTLRQVLADGDGTLL